MAHIIIWQNIKSRISSSTDRSGKVCDEYLKYLYICEISDLKNMNSKLSAGKNKSNFWKDIVEAPGIGEYLTALMQDGNLSEQFVQGTPQSSQTYLTSNQIYIKNILKACLHHKRRDGVDYHDRWRTTFALSPAVPSWAQDGVTEKGCDCGGQWRPSHL